MNWEIYSNASRQTLGPIRAAPRRQLEAELSHAEVLIDRLKEARGTVDAVQSGPFSEFFNNLVLRAVFAANFQNETLRSEWSLFHTRRLTTMSLHTMSMMGLIPSLSEV